MSFSFKRRVYESLPSTIRQGIGLIPFGWIAGRAYRDTLRRNDFIDKATREVLRDYQSKRLGDMLRFATRYVPAYANLQGTVERYKPFTALQAFPMVSKEDMQRDLNRYLPINLSEIPHYECTTGGTSGNQLKFFLDDPSQSVETAFIHRQWARVGYNPRRRKATFRGVPFENLGDGIFWQHNPIYNELQFSPFHMHDGTLALYIDQLRQYRPDYLHGYPSAIDVLAEYVLRKNLQSSLPAFKAVLLGSEGCFPAQRQRIEAAFGTRAYSWYGHSERLILAGECECEATYHHFPDYGVLEIIDDNGRACNDEGDRGELVGTGLLNYSMPLIRYRTGDYARRRAPECACGRMWDRFDQVEGRWRQDMIIGRNGARISLAALNMHGALFERVVRYQYYQEKMGVCQIKVLPAPGFAEDDRLQIQQSYQQKVGNEVEINVICVDEIPLTARGKLRLLDSRIAI